MIGPVDDFGKESKKVYSHRHGGVWRMVSYCAGPTVQMENIHTEERIRFGIYGQISQDFKEISGIEWDADKCEIMPEEKK